MSKGALLLSQIAEKPHPHLLTTFAENGEVDLLMAGDRFVLSACEERPCGCDRVHSRRLTLQLTRRDAADLRRNLDCLLRESPRSGQWSDTALADVGAQRSPSSQRPLSVFRSSNANRARFGNSDHLITASTARTTSPCCDESVRALSLGPIKDL